MILEELNASLRGFFDEHSDCGDRWKRLCALFDEDYASARVLFLTEVLALIDKWREPTSTELNSILNHMLEVARLPSLKNTSGELSFPYGPLKWRSTT